jgi:hypothetical protein
VRLRTVPELGNALSLLSADGENEDGVVRLATDLELLRSAKQGRRYGTQAGGGRGQPDTTIWAIGRRGHLLSDRLPVGAFATDASTLNNGAASGGRRSSSGNSGGATTTSLAIQFDVPVGCYISSMLREFVTLRRTKPTAGGAVAADVDHSYDGTKKGRTSSVGEANNSARAAAVQSAQAAGDVDGNLLSFTVKGNMSLEDAVRTGRATDVLRSGKSVPRFLGASIDAADDDEQK